MKAGAHANDVVITGLPRSGTSHLCVRLNSIDNSVAVNEPQAIFGLLDRPPIDVLRRVRRTSRERRPTYARRLVGYYRELRRKLLNGETILNKDTEDTKIIDKPVPWRPTNIQNESFTLATKNTLWYTCNLRAITLERLRVVALIRHPVHCIKSWQTSSDRLSHLRDARIPPYHRLRDEALSREQRDAYAAIQREQDQTKKLCEFWNFLTDIYLKHSSELTIIRYEDLIKAPGTTLASIVGDPVPQGLVSETGRVKEYAHNESEQATIWKYCERNASALGYSV